MHYALEPLESRQLLSSVPHITAGASLLAFDQIQGTLSAPKTLTIKNTGPGKLVIKSIALSGPNAGNFIVRAATRRMSLSRGASLSFNVSFMPYGVAVSGASLDITTNDPAMPVLSIPLRGLGLAGFFANLEPSLQRILDTLQIPDSVGDSTPDIRDIDGLAPSDEVPLQLMKKAAPGPVTVTPLAVFGWNTNPVATLGWYTRTTSVTAHPLFSVPLGFGQSLFPPTLGARTFDPGAATFGLFGNWPSETHTTFTEDALNTWYTLNSQHAVRVFPYKTAAGQVVPNSYVVAFEQGADNDFQDAVVLIQNVMPAF